MRWEYRLASGPSRGSNGIKTDTLCRSNRQDPTWIVCQRTRSICIFSAVNQNAIGNAVSVDDSVRRGRRILQCREVTVDKAHIDGSHGGGKVVEIRLREIAPLKGDIRQRRRRWRQVDHGTGRSVLVEVEIAKSKRRSSSNVERTAGKQVSAIPTKVLCGFYSATSVQDRWRSRLEEVKVPDRDVITRCRRNPAVVLAARRAVVKPSVCIDDRIFGSIQRESGTLMDHVLDFTLALKGPRKIVLRGSARSDNTILEDVASEIFWIG